MTAYAVADIPTASIVTGINDRTYFNADELRVLAESIAADGLGQPPTVPVRVTLRTGRVWVGAFGMSYPTAAWARLFVREDGAEVALQPREVASVVSAACDGCACGIRHACTVSA